MILYHALLNWVITCPLQHVYTQITKVLADATHTDLFRVVSTLYVCMLGLFSSVVIVRHSFDTHGGRNYLIWKMNTLHISPIVQFDQWLHRLFEQPSYYSVYCWNTFRGTYFYFTRCAQNVQDNAYTYWLSLNIIKGHIIYRLWLSVAGAGGNLNEFVQIITRSFNPELICALEQNI